MSIITIYKCQNLSGQDLRCNYRGVTDYWTGETKFCGINRKLCRIDVDTDTYNGDNEDILNRIKKNYDLSEDELNDIKDQLVINDVDS